MFATSTIILFIVLGINHTTEAIFSSLIRNNLNRYLKNPLFTKSFVRNSNWNGESDDIGSLSTTGFIAQPQHSEIHFNDYIKHSHSIPNNPHQILEPYGHYNFEISPIHSDDYPKMISPPVILKSLSHKMDNTVKFPGSVNNFEPEVRASSKSMLTVSSSTNANAYSDSKRINSSLNNKNNSNQKIQSEKMNLYVNDEALLNLEDSFKKTNHYNKKKKVFAHYPKKHSNYGKYNQEKALNLKLEYGFKPLPSRKNSPSINSIQPPETESENESLEELESKNDLTAVETETISRSNFIHNNRTMKSMETNGNHLDETGISPDYKKYLSYPMETESSDVHKLAFTGVESFHRPDHGYLNVGYEQNSYRYLDTISNYPHIKHFKKQGIECARNLGYCEYDSSYPIDYINPIITNCTSIIDDMYIEMPENMNDFNGYKSLFQLSTGLNINNNNQQMENVSLCESERKYIRPSVIKDINDNYYLILQSSFYLQQVPVEICLKPGTSCNLIGRCNSQVKCVQKYRTQMLISVDHVESNNNQSNDYQHWDQSKPLCPKMRMYRLPSACVCELSQE